MLQKHKRIALGIGAAVGTAGIVTAIAVPLALKNKDDNNDNQAVVIDKAKHAQVYTDAKSLVVAATGAGATTTTVEKVSTKSNGDTIIEGSIATAAHRAAAVSTAAIKFVLILDKAGIVLSYTENGVDKKAVVKAHQPAITGKFTAVKNSIKESKLIEVTKTEPQLRDAINKATGAIIAQPTGLTIAATVHPTLTPGTPVEWTFSVVAKDGYKLATGTPATFKVDITAPAVTTPPVTPTVTTVTKSLTDLQATVNPTTGAITPITGLVITPANNNPSLVAGTAVPWNFSVAAASGYQLGTMPTTFTVQVTKPAAPLQDWTDAELLATVTGNDVKAAINAILTTKTGDAPTSLPSTVATVTVKATKAGTTTHNAASKDLSIAITYASTEHNAGSITVSFDNGTPQSVVIAGWTSYDPNIQALKGITATAALKTTVTKANVKASTIAATDFDITATLTGATFAVVIESTDDPKGELTYHITGTKNGQTHDYAPVTISGFLTTKQELTASLTAAKIDTTTVTVSSKTKLASAVQASDITLPTLTGFTFLPTLSATDSTGTLSVTVVGTSTADATVTRTETVSITGFHQLLTDPTAAVATLAAAADGTTITVSDADASDNMTAVVKGSISAGATTATITVSATGIYVFAGDTQTKDVSGVAVDQTAYELTTAKANAKTAINGISIPTVNPAAHSQTTFDAIAAEVTKQLGLVGNAADVAAVELIAKGSAGTAITAINAAITAYNNSTGTDAADVAAEKTIVEGETFTALADTATGNLDQTKLAALGLTPKDHFTYTGVLSGAAGAWKVVITITKGSASVDTSSLDVADAPAPASKPALVSPTDPSTPVVTTPPSGR